MTSNPADFVFFKLVNNYLTKQIKEFGLDVLERATTLASATALTLVTLWIMIQGYRMITGQSQRSMMSVMSDMGRIVVIVMVATAAAMSTRQLYDFVSTDMDRVVTELFTGERDKTSSKLIDENLAWTQVAISAIDAVQLASEPSPDLREEKSRALLYAQLGAASPPMAAGAMLLLYRFTVALLIGLAPIFILFLIFDQTKELFRKWLFYLIGTLFSMGVLAFVTSVALSLSARVAGAIWGAKFINNLLGVDNEGLSSQAMQTGGIGLLLTALIVSMPPIAAMLFQGVAGNFMTYSAWQSNSSPANGMPPGSYASTPARHGASPISERPIPPIPSLNFGNSPALPDAVKIKT